MAGDGNNNEQKRRELKTDEQKVNYRHIAGLLASRYEVIYYVNIINNEYIWYCSGEGNNEPGSLKGGSDFFKEVPADLAEMIFKDDKDYVLSGIEKDNLLGNLEKSGNVTLTYRQDLGGDIRYVSLNAIRNKYDDEHIVVGLINIDDQMKRERSLIEESRVFNDVAMALASRYEVIYRVNIITNEYYEFSSSEKYTKLEVGIRGDDFFADSQINMERDIYEEDYPMMARAMVKENILSRLKESNKITLNYRLNLDGRPQYVSLIIISPSKNPDYIIVAVENIDEAKRKEKEFEFRIDSAMDMALTDALTGVKNKFAYVNAETQLNSQINDNTAPEFALAVCDINGLKDVNDEYGHSAGDDYIRDACVIICRIFDHSPVFRIGGDEFVVILRGHDYENRDDLKKRFYNAQIDNRHKGLVTIAYGMSEYIPGRDLTVQDVFERADDLMYENKKRFKEQPINEEAQSIESYSFVRFYELYEQLLAAMVDFDNVDVKLINELLKKTGLMFRLCKGVTRVYRNPQEEIEGKGEIFIPFDLGKEGYEVLTLRCVTSVLTSATCTVYMSPDEEPLSREEKEKISLVMKTVLSFVSRNRMRDVVYELAYFDESGYPNLRNLNRELAKLVARGGFKGKMAIRYNLRHFSIINQEFGREAGDRIMRTHFESLKAILGEEGFVARLGGDNFVAIGPKDRLVEVRNFLAEAVIRVDNNSSVRVPSSAGFLLDTEGFVPSNPGDIMGKIINAYRYAQSGGKDHIIFYDEGLMIQKQKDASVQQKLSEALAKKEFRPFYQPKVDVNTGKIIGGEALCRWYHKGKIIMPAEFIPSLEQTNDICKLDLYILENVCRDQRKWLDGGPGRKLVPMSVNFSRKHIINMDLPDTIEKILDKYRIPHDAIEIELTETTTDVGFSDLKRVVTELRSKGIATSIDDFGIGFSSMNILKGIPWRTIKIDKSFIPNEEDEADSEKYIMFKGVVSLAKSLGIRCIAEGIETEFQVNIMRENGCDIAQGFYYDKPLPKEEFEARLVTKMYDPEDLKNKNA